MITELLEKFEDLFKPLPSEEVKKRNEGNLTKVKRDVKKYGGRVVDCGPAKISNPDWKYFWAVIDFNRTFDRKNENDMNFIKKAVVDGLKAEEDPDNPGYYWVGTSPTDYPVWLFIKGLGNIDVLKAEIL